MLDAAAAITLRHAAFDVDAAMLPAFSRYIAYAAEYSAAYAAAVTHATLMLPQYTLSPCCLQRHYCR